MRFKGLDLNLLVTLNVLLQEKSVAAAARRLHRSPSSVSTALGNLRHAFDDDLLVRRGRRLVLTALGETLVAPIEQLMGKIDQTLDMAKASGPPAEAP